MDLNRYLSTLASTGVGTVPLSLTSCNTNTWSLKQLYDSRVSSQLSLLHPAFAESERQTVRVTELSQEARERESGAGGVGGSKVGEGSEGKKGNILKEELHIVLSSYRCKCNINY